MIVGDFWGRGKVPLPHLLFDSRKSRVYVSVGRGPVDENYSHPSFFLRILGSKSPGRALCCRFP